MGAHPSNKAHKTKKLEFGQSWHFGQFRHADFKSDQFFFDPSGGLRALSPPSASRPRHPAASACAALSAPPGTPEPWNGCKGHHWGLCYAMAG